MNKRKRWMVTVAAVLVATSANAQFAVIDVGAITQLIQQVKTMSDQLETARQQLTQAERTLDAMRGSRGMDQLLAGTVRNYLPPSWAELESAIVRAQGRYQRLASEFQRVVQDNRILSPEVLARLSDRDRTELEAARRAAAVMQVTAQQAYQTSSDRFASLQQLTTAIGTAADQKAILDLQARIAAEQGMLANEQTKLYVLTQSIEAEERVRRQRLKEEATDAFGSLRTLPPIGL